MAQVGSSSCSSSQSGSMSMVASMSGAQAQLYAEPGKNVPFGGILAPNALKSSFSTINEMTHYGCTKDGCMETVARAGSNNNSKNGFGSMEACILACPTDLRNPIKYELQGTFPAFQR